MSIDFFIAIENFLGSGMDMSSVLLVMVIFDTATGVAWRVKAGRSIISHSFNIGIIVNIVTALLPLILNRLGNFNHSSAPLYGLAEVIISIFIAISIGQSIIANLKLYGVNFPHWADVLIKKWIGEEIRDKKERR